MAPQRPSANLPMRNFPFGRVNWTTSAFLVGTAAATLTAVPWYLWTYGLDWFQALLFLAYFMATGLSITLGYHRLFSHLAFEASWPVKLFTLVFGAAAFENSVLDWASDHRRHHKHVDHDEDPYDINKGFFWAHIGWLLFKLKSGPYDNVPDLQRDRMVAFQHKYYYVLAVLFGFVVPAALGGLVGGPAGALGGFLLAGVARIVFVQHMTFFINSLCHTVGARPYSSRCSARDSLLMAFFTFGEGYHNYHHEFQHDYRNGVKPWQFDPTKWTIWLLSRVGLVTGLRRVPDERILAAELAEARRQIAAGLQAPHFAPPARPAGQAVLEQAAASFQHMQEQASASLHQMQEQAAAQIQHLGQEWNRSVTDLRRHAEARVEEVRRQLETLQAQLAERSAALQAAAREKVQLPKADLRALRRELRRVRALLDELYQEGLIPAPAAA